MPGHIVETIVVGPHRLCNLALRYVNAKVLVAKDPFTEYVEFCINVELCLLFQFTEGLMRSDWALYQYYIVRNIINKEMFALTLLFPLRMDPLHVLYLLRGVTVRMLDTLEQFNA